MEKFIEVYASKNITDKEYSYMKERIKNIHYYQVFNEDEFNEALEPQKIKLDNNKYYKKFNLFAT